MCLFGLLNLAVTYEHALEDYTKVTTRCRRLRRMGIVPIVNLIAEAGTSNASIREKARKIGELLSGPL